MTPETITCIWDKRAGQAGPFLPYPCNPPNVFADTTWRTSGGYLYKESVIQNRQVKQRGVETVRKFDKLIVPVVLRI